MNKTSLMFTIFALFLLTDLSFSGEPRSQAQGHFISSLNAKVTGLRFYEGGYGKVPYKQRDYGSEFPKSSTRYVWWELGFEYPKGSPRTDFEVLAIYYNTDGSIFRQHTSKTFYIDPAVASVEYSHGYMYETGEGVKQDYARAAQLYEKACSGGDALGCADLGDMYRNGKGVAEDRSRAVMLYRKAVKLDKSIEELLKKKGIQLEEEPKVRPAPNKKNRPSGATELPDDLGEL